MKIELSGIPFLLTIVFVVLKLCNVIAWSWWWVFSPLLAFPVCFIVFLLLIFLFALVAKFVLNLQGKIK